MTTVAGLAVTAVKGTRLQDVHEVLLERDGARGNRRFFVIDERGRMVNGKQLGALQTVVADFSEGDRRLVLTFPDGMKVEGSVELDGSVETRFYSSSLAARLVRGPWAAALSDHVGRPLRLVEADGEGAGVDRGREGGVSLISRASLARLASAAGEPDVDARRFRMLIEIAGVDAHEEDSWVGRSVRIGDALVTFGGHVGRCLITSRDPESGEIDLPTLDIIRGYRDDSATTEPLPFGVYGEVIGSGTVRVGDPVTLT